MGIFDRFKKKESTDNSAIRVTSVTRGKYVPMNEIPDDVFAGGMLGPCCGVDPEEGKVLAPIDGTVITVADTLHAIGIEGNGVELLIHVGIDTVNMKGDGFSSHIQEGQKVKKGDLLLGMDLDKIKAAGYSPIIITIVTNADSFSNVSFIGAGQMDADTEMIRIEK